MRIALVGGRDFQQFPALGYGGVEACVENLAWGLHRNACDFAVIVPKRREIRDYPFEIIESPVEPATGAQIHVWPFARSLPDLVRTASPDVIWSQCFWSAETLAPLGIPIICTFHDIVMPGDRPDARWFHPRPNVWYRFVSRHHYHQWVDPSVRWQRERSFFLLTGMADEEYRYYGPEQRGDHCLWVGGLKWGLEAKGLHIFLKLAMTHQSREFVIYGSGSDAMAAELSRLDRMVPNLHFMGPLARGEAHADAFGRARLYVMPTQLPEPLGRTNLESMTKGTPVLGSTHGALPELIRNAVSGHTAETMDDYHRLLEQSYDFRRCYSYARRFHIDHEVAGLMRASEAIMAEEAHAI